MNLRTYIYTCILAVPLLLLACQNDEVYLDTTISGGMFEDLYGDPGVKAFTVRTLSSWTISSSADWVAFSPSSGVGPTTVYVEYGTNASDDPRSAEFVITASGKGEQMSLSFVISQTGGSGVTQRYGWAELPDIQDDGDRVFVSHFTELGGRRVRNYSMLYDKTTYTAGWVAYPLHRSYMGSGRTDNWEYDPEVPAQFQANLYRSYGAKGYDRGHQIPSADRNATTAMNDQTFYFTNMTPQLSRLNQDKWVALEIWLRNNTPADTLYVVTGAVLETVGGNESVQYITNRDGKRIPVPNYYYKVALKRKGSSYTSIGFWFEHKAASGAIQIKDAVTVRSIEEKTGYDFFANLAREAQDEAETQIVAGDWRF